MKSLDTNVVVRFIIGDDPAQFRVADRIMDGNVLLTPTVILETAWILGSRYSLSREETAAALLPIMDMDNVAVPDEPLVRWSIARMCKGADLADMIHLVMSRDANIFSTFDQRLAKCAGPESPIEIETLKA